jgi:hypothetical protein
MREFGEPFELTGNVGASGLIHDLGRTARFELRESGLPFVAGPGEPPHCGCGDVRAIARRHADEMQIVHRKVAFICGYIGVGGKPCDYVGRYVTRRSSFGRAV